MLISYKVIRKTNLKLHSFFPKDPILPLQPSFENLRLSVDRYTIFTKNPH